MLTTTDRIAPPRWPSEEALFVFAVLGGVSVWFALIISIIGIVYAVILGLMFAFMQLVLAGHIRGNGVRLGPDQMPELYAAVARIAQRMEMKRVPEAYLMQMGGALNAFATRFLMADMIVLYSDLLEACGEDEGARDMIIGHELAHIRLGHLRWRWLTAPSMLIPFLGMALSRAREYSCDRYGAAVAGTRDSAVLGLCILAAGGRLAGRVNRTAFVQQRELMNTGTMALAEWLMTHPPLTKRIAAIEPALTGGRKLAPRGPLRALAAMATIVLLLVAAGVVGLMKLAPAFKQALDEAARTNAQRTGSGAVASPPARRDPAAITADSVQAMEGMRSLAAVLEPLQGSDALPATDSALWAAWRQQNPGRDLPKDPFDGEVFGYEHHGTSWMLWSSGPDGAPNTADDLVLRGP